MGGRDAFNGKLDSLFIEQYETPNFSFLGQFRHCNGAGRTLCSVYERSFHIPHLYVFSGQPRKTLRRVCQLMDVWYGDGPLGCPEMTMVVQLLRCTSSARWVSIRFAREVPV
jgi:putative alpha-1,2-mannosidase